MCCRLLPAVTIFTLQTNMSLADWRHTWEISFRDIKKEYNFFLNRAFKY